MYHSPFLMPGGGVLHSYTIFVPVESSGKVYLDAPSAQRMCLSRFEHYLCTKNSIRIRFVDVVVVLIARYQAIQSTVQSYRKECRCWSALVERWAAPSLLLLPVATS